MLAAVAGFLGLNALNDAQTSDLSIIFAYIPLGIAVLIALAALCILVGIWTPSARRGGMVVVILF